MTEDSMAPTPEGVSRRDLLTFSWRLVAALLAAQGGLVGARFLLSRQDANAFGAIVTAGAVDEFAPGSVTPFDAARFILVRFEDGGFVALYNRCTHLACVVNWREELGEFACPCHGSHFATDGTVINPPAPRPLDRCPVTIDDDGQVVVDTRERIRRSAANPADRVYPPQEPPAS